MSSSIGLRGVCVARCVYWSSMGMQLEQTVPRERQEARDPVQTLLRGAVYEALTSAQLRRRASRMEGVPDEALERVLTFTEGLEAHEEANTLFLDEWRGEVEKAEAPERLTHEEVAARFAAWPKQAELLAAESQALAQYEALLADETDWTLPVTDRIALTRWDVAAIVNDLQVRAAERIADADARGEQLDALDETLAQMVDAMPESEGVGKKLELEELYLLRRLIHAADTGHVMSVEHATPREDLDRHKAIDLHVSVAGRAVPVQVKTLKSDVHVEGRWRQAALMAHTEARFAGKETSVVRLEREAVEQAYRKARRAPAHVPHRTDTFTALQPLVNALPARMRNNVFPLTGTTEAVFAEERMQFEARQAEMRALQASYFLKEEARAQAAAREAAQEEAAQEEAALQAKRDAIAQHEAAQAADADARIRERADADFRKRRAAEQHAEESLRRAEEERVLAALRAEEEAARAAQEEARRQKRKEKEALGWPPKTFAGMLTPPLLQGLGLLSTDWRNDPQALLGAKKAFLQLFAKPKKGKNPVDTDAPNAFFKSVFPQAHDMASPDSAVLEQIHGVQKAA